MVIADAAVVNWARDVVAAPPGVRSDAIAGPTHGVAGPTEGLPRPCMALPEVGREQRATRGCGELGLVALAVPELARGAEILSVAATLAVAVVARALPVALFPVRRRTQGPAAVVPKPSRLAVTRIVIAPSFGAMCGRPCGNPLIKETPLAFGRT